MCATVVIIWVSGHSLVLEMFGKKYRPYVAFIEQSTWPSHLVTVGLAYATRQWKYTYIWSGVVSCLAWPCLYFIPGETFRL